MYNKYEIVTNLNGTFLCKCQNLVIFLKCGALCNTYFCIVDGRVREQDVRGPRSLSLKCVKSTGSADAETCFLFERAQCQAPFLGNAPPSLKPSSPEAIRIRKICYNDW